MLLDACVSYIDNRYIFILVLFSQYWKLFFSRIVILDLALQRDHCRMNAKTEVHMSEIKYFPFTLNHFRVENLFPEMLHWTNGQRKVTQLLGFTHLFSLFSIRKNDKCVCISYQMSDVTMCPWEKDQLWRKSLHFQSWELREQLIN